MKFKNDIEAQSNIILDGALADAGGSPGTVNQLLSSTATGTAWIDPSTIVAEAATLVVIACKNTSGAAIAQGTPVYQTGTVGATATIEIAPADALISANKLPAIGLLQTALNNNGLGFVVITGELTNFTTSPIDGVVPTTGDKVFVKSGGGLTLTKPTGEGNGIQNMGLVGKVSGGNAGSITVSSIMRTNDVPNLPEGRIWIGDGNTIVSDTVYVDEPNNRVGIGTATPGAKLDVNGAGNFSGGTVVSGIDTYTNVGVAIEKGDYLYSNDGNYLRRLIGQQTGGSIDIGQQGTSLISNINFFPGTSGNIDFFGSGSIDMRVASSGNIGIGTTNPQEKLQINGGYIKIIDNAYDEYFLSKTRTDGSQLLGFKSHPLGALSIHSAGSEAMRIDSAGNVGIGTDSPAAKLHVDGTAIFDTQTGAQPFYITREGAANQALKIYVDDSAAIFESIQDETADNYGAFQFILDAGVTEPYFDVKKGTGSANILFRVDGNGYVGIGTTSPSEKLEVDGNVKISGDLTVSGGDIILGGTGRIQGVDTVSAGTDAANKLYVDNAVSGVSSGVTSVATTNGITGGTITSTGTLQVDSTVVRTSGAQSIGDVKTFTSRADFSNGDGLRTNQVRTYGGQQLVLNAGESSSYATGQTNELVYLNAESGIQINSSPDNWSSGWAGRKTTTINDASGNSTFANDITVSGGDITLGGTGRIQGVDTVSASTDAANKAYVDNAVAGVPQGDITQVTAGYGLTGGGTSGAVTLNVVGGTGITANANDIAIDATVATLAGTQTFTGAKTINTLKIGTANKIQFGNNDFIRYDDANGVGRFHFDSDGGTNNSSVQAATFVGALSGNATTASTLQTARTIAGVSFNGSANISLNNNAITNGAGYTTNTGDITSVVAGTNLNGGGTSGAVTLNLDAAIELTSVQYGSGVTLSESADRADLLYVRSSTSSWGGLQIGNTSNEFIFSLMGDGTTGGIYDDQNSDWIIQWTENNAVRLYYNAAQKLATTSTGVSITGDLTVSGGDITLSGTGRIQGVDTVSSGTDATNKAYVDNAVAAAPQGTVTGSGTAGYIPKWGTTSALANSSALYNGTSGLLNINNTFSGSPAGSSSSPDLWITGSTTNSQAVVALMNAKTTSTANQVNGDIEFGTKDDSSAGYVSARIRGIQTSASGSGGAGRGELQFATNVGNTGASPETRMVINYAGNVGIGTTSPLEKLEVQGTIYATPISYASNQNAYVFKMGANNNTAFDQGIKIKSTSGGVSYMSFNSRNEDTLVLRNANVGIGTADPQATLHIDNPQTSSNNIGVILEGAQGGYSTIGMKVNIANYGEGIRFVRTSIYNGNALKFFSNTSQVGSVFVNTSSTSYNTTSDYRSKENVVPMENSINRLKELKPCRFNFIIEPENTVDGFIAHEAQEVVPESVTGEKDKLDYEGNPEYQGIDQSKLVPLLTSALQEAINKIEQLETRMQTLENN